MKESDFWTFHLEYLKVAIALSSAIIAAGAAIYVDETKIPADNSRYWLGVSVIFFTIMLISSVASLACLANHIVMSSYNPNPTTTVTVSRSKGSWWGITFANVSFLTLVLAVGCLAAFYVKRTWYYPLPSFDRTIALAKNGLQLDSTKNETASLKTLDLQGDKYVITFTLSPGGGNATVVTDALGTTIQSIKK